MHSIRRPRAWAATLAATATLLLGPGTGAALAATDGAAGAAVAGGAVVQTVDTVAGRAVADGTVADRGETGSAAGGRVVGTGLATSSLPFALALLLWGAVTVHRAGRVERD